jgi:hypothetical protein
VEKWRERVSTVWHKIVSIFVTHSVYYILKVEEEDEDERRSQYLLRALWSRSLSDILTCVLLSWPWLAGQCI